MVEHPWNPPSYHPCCCWSHKNKPSSWSNNVQSSGSNTVQVSWSNYDRDSWSNNARLRCKTLRTVGELFWPWPNHYTPRTLQPPIRSRGQTNRTHTYTSTQPQQCTNTPPWHAYPLQPHCFLICFCACASVCVGLSVCMCRITELWRRPIQIFQSSTNPALMSDGQLCAELNLTLLGFDGSSRTFKGAARGKQTVGLCCLD